MAAQLELLAVAIITVIGALVSAGLGWLDSGESFDARKFSSSIIRAIIAGLTVFMGFTFDPSTITVFDYIMAFLAGAGVDVLGHRAALSITAKTPTG